MGKRLFRVSLASFFFYILSLGLIVNAISPLLPPGMYSPIILFLGLFWPFLILALIIIFVVFLRKNRVFLIAGFLLVVMNMPVVINSFGFHFFSSTSSDHQENRKVKLLSWNVSRWDERNKKKRGGVSYRESMLAYIAQEGAEILCIQEFFECKNPKYFQSTIKSLREIGYTYHAFYPHHALFDSTFLYGLAIFSRFPILRSFWIPNELGEHSEGVMYADLNINGSQIRVFNSHLESIGLHGEFGGYLKNATVTKLTWNKIKSATELRTRQATNLAKIISESPYKNVVCVDIGDLPNSISYRKLRYNLKDCFTESSSGFGKTYNTWISTARIDYIFVNQQIKVNFQRAPAEKYSDHFPLVIHFLLP